jgi:uncharacterized protein YprB with RNaseH-like and TPR domain
VQGNVEVAQFLQQSASFLPYVGLNAALEKISLNKILFIDTETTGLSGGAGTYVFLVGFGYFVNDHFRVGQLFMNDYDEEGALLTELNEVVADHELIVSYNGKSFDAPLLLSRNIVQGFKSPLSTILHFDLLHAVRRLWKHRLAECTLGTVENEMIGSFRHGDVPGYLIPHIYFNYLRSKDAAPLKPVLYHNRQDILSMVALLTKALSLIEKPLERCQTVKDVLAIANIYEKWQQHDKSISLYTDVLRQSDTTTEHNEVRLRLARAYKKLCRWQQAADVWRQCLTTGPYHPLPYIELAKHCEHREKDYHSAKGLVVKALQEMRILQTLGRDTAWQIYREDLERRLVRLTGKTGS